MKAIAIGTNRVVERRSKNGKPMTPYVTVVGVKCTCHDKRVVDLRCHGRGNWFARCAVDTRDLLRVHSWN